MRKLLAGAVVAGMLIVPTQASAHTLSAGLAKRVVKKIAYDLADEGELYGAVGCYRLSRHSVACTARTYDEVDDIQCDTEIKVRFVNAYSYRTRWTVLSDPDCY